MRLDFKQVLQSLELLTKLREFDPIVIGTPPLGIDIETSDIDIACSANDLDSFKMVASTEFSKCNGFRCRDANLQDLESVVVQFQAFNWDIELFCQTIPTNQQWGVRHFSIEQRLLNLEPRLKKVVSYLKKNGLKTEPAFTAALGLSGDPYSVILEIEDLNDAELAQLITNSQKEF